ncbi:MAG: type II secretion system major pseudopilin GspG, partial [Phycisphaeraceae bacterium]
FTQTIAMKKQRKQLYRSSAFSILELLLVLVILGILAGIVGVRFAGQSGKAKVTATKTQLSNLETALSNYEIDMGEYPATQDGLKALREAPSGVDEDDYRQGGYLAKAIIDDEWGNPWQYRYPGTKNEYGYDLYSYGPDGKEGGDDDITNWSEDED